MNMPPPPRFEEPPRVPPPRRSRWSWRRAGEPAAGGLGRRRRGWVHILIALVIAIIVVVVVALIYHWVQVPPLPRASEPTAERTSAGPWTDVSRGRYLVRAGDCASCHTADGGQPFAGGRPVPTPFGTIYSTNITPDPTTGIGRWSFEQFYRALHHGIRRDGKRLYPAFPYTAYTKVTREDVLAIKTYLDTVKPVRQTAIQNELPWPLDVRAGLTAWNAMFFDAGTFQPNPNESADWNRGAYLVEGLLHCAACHTPRNIAGAEKQGQAFAGGHAENAFAPSLRAARGDGLGGWSQNDLVEYLKTGSTDFTAAAGPMAEVIERSTQHLSDGDLRAVAVYLKKLPSDDSGSRGTAPVKTDSDDSRHADKDSMQRGESVYIDNCQACHMAGGTGQKGVFPQLKGSSAVVAAEPDTLILVLLQGARTPRTGSKPTGLQMPAFDRKLSDAEMADVLTYIRNAWGNSAGTVSAHAVADKRKVANRAP